MTKAIIFDVDGTLVDSVDLHALAWQDAFRDFGHNHEITALREQIGKGGDQLMPMFMSEEEIEKDGKRLDKHRDQILKSKYLSQIEAFPNVRQLFQRILKDGKVIALASSAKQADLAKYKDLADITDLLDTETSSDDVEKSKPYPDIFQAALKKLGDLSPRDAVVVGDTPYDAQAAAKAGIRTVGLLCGGWSEEDLMTAGCVAVYRDPSDLLARYEGSPLAEA